MASSRTKVAVAAAVVALAAVVPTGAFVARRAAAAAATREHARQPSADDILLGVPKPQVVHVDVVGDATTSPALH